MTNSIPSTSEADAEALKIFNLQTRACLDQPFNQLVFTGSSRVINTVRESLISLDQDLRVVTVSRAVPSMSFSR